MAAVKPGEAKGAPSAASPSRPYANRDDELNRPYVPGDSRADQAKNAESWRWIALAGLAASALISYTWLWPALSDLLYRPSPLRNYLLPPSPDPVYVIAGVGVGWFWVLFVASPAAAGALAALWSAAVAITNRRARRGYDSQVRPGQKWAGEQYPTGPLCLAGAALLLTLAGVLLRWAGAAANTAPGGMLILAILAVLVCGYARFARWAYARGLITGQINTVAYLAAPALGWPDLRAGRVKVMRCSYPRKATPFPKAVKLLYGQHPRSGAVEMLGPDLAAILNEVTGHTYAMEHDPLTRTFIATEAEFVEIDPVVDAEAVLAPLVGSWFDSAATILSVNVDRPAVVIDEDGNPVGDAPIELEQDEELAKRAAKTVNDLIAARIKEFTVGFAYNRKVDTPYRQGMIESAVSNALGGSWEADWSIPSLRVRFVRCPGLPTMVPPPLDFPEVTRATIRTLYKTTPIPFAIDAYGNTIFWDFKQSPHMLVAGATSTGKTSVLMTLGTQCARRIGANLVFIDPKGFDTPGLRDWPNVSMVTAGTDEDGLVGHTAAIRYLADTMQERLSLVKVNPNRADDFDPIVVVTDEFSNLVVALAEFYSSYRTTREKSVPPTTKDVGILLRTARAVAIHMVIGIQRPDTMFIAGEARDNTALRVAMGRLRSKDAALMMFNDPVAGTRVQPGIKGRGTVQLPDGTFREIQAFYTPKIPATEEQRAELNESEVAILEELSNVNSFWPRRVVDSALRDYDPTDPEQKSEMSFAKIRDSEIVLASTRPDLDPLSDEYVMPGAALKRPTMDDDHEEYVSAPKVTHDDVGNPILGPDHQPVTAEFSSEVDGYDDDYLPGTDDEYGPAMTMAATEVAHGDLVDVSVASGSTVPEWTYVHAEPYRIEDDEGTERLVISFRDLDDGQSTGDIDVDPYELVSVRQLKMVD